MADTTFPTTDYVTSQLQLMRGQGAMVGAGATGTYTSEATSRKPWLLLLGAGLVLAFLFMRRR